MTWQVVYTRRAQKDATKIAQSNLKKKTEELLSILEQNPFQAPPQFEKLLGDLDETYSRRVNIQDCLVYQVIDEERIVKVLRMWTH